MCGKKQKPRFLRIAADWNFEFVYLLPVEFTYKLHPRRYSRKPVAEERKGEVGKSLHTAVILAASFLSVNSVSRQVLRRVERLRGML
jgi:hypothetical protein